MSTAAVKASPTTVKRRPRTILRAITFLTVASFVILVITGLAPLFLGKHVGGIALLLHVGVGGLFAACLALLVVAFSTYYAFDTPVSASPAPAFRKVLFWLFAAGGLSLIVSAVLMMMPLFGTPGQANLVAWHRWTSYFEVVVAVLFAFSLLSTRRRA